MKKIDSSRYIIETIERYFKDYKDSRNQKALVIGFCLGLKLNYEEEISTLENLLPKKKKVKNL